MALLGVLIALAVPVIRQMSRMETDGSAWLRLGIGWRRLTVSALAGTIDELERCIDLAARHLASSVPARR